MIRLTRLDGSELYLNEDLIELVEETPDTHITLINGNRYVVHEKASVLIDRIVAQKIRVMRRVKGGPSKAYLRRER